MTNTTARPIHTDILQIVRDRLIGHDQLTEHECRTADDIFELAATVESPSPTPVWMVSEPAKAALMEHMVKRVAVEVAEEFGTPGNRHERRRHLARMRKGRS